MEFWLMPEEQLAKLGKLINERANSKFKSNLKFASACDIDYNRINQPNNIVDGLGRVVLKGNLNEVDKTINIEQLSKGIYYLNVSDNTASKFIKK